MTTADGTSRLVQLQEWETRSVLDVNLLPGDEALLETLARGDGTEVRLQSRWLHDGTLRLQSRSWVGVVRVAGLEIRIVPKLAGSSDGVARMLEFTQRGEAIHRLTSSQFVEVGEPNLVDLICWLLAEEAARILQLGVLSDYVEREETISALRGRLRTLDQARHQFGRVDRLECRFDEFEPDILENRIVAAGLRVARRVVSQPRIRRLVELMEPIFAELCGENYLDPALAEIQLIPTRRNRSIAKPTRGRYYFCAIRR